MCSKLKFRTNNSLLVASIPIPPNLHKLKFKNSKNRLPTMKSKIPKQDFKFIPGNKNTKRQSPEAQVSNSKSQYQQTYSHHKIQNPIPTAGISNIQSKIQYQHHSVSFPRSENQYQNLQPENHISISIASVPCSHCQEKQHQNKFRLQGIHMLFFLPPSESPQHTQITYPSVLDLSSINFHTQV